MPPTLFVVVDTEEEFDWNAPYRRSNTAVTAMRHIGRAQSIFERFGVSPTYVIDYPVAAQPEGYEPLQEIAAAGRCLIGAHLHPWVNPPYDEDVNAHNSFMMNLPAWLQRSKLEALSQAIASRFPSPRVFKAGRYGLGQETVTILDSLGFEVDNSVSPAMDFTREGGPSFIGMNSMPFFLTNDLLELPCTIDYVGWAGTFRETLHNLASNEALQRVRAVGVLAKAGVVNKIMLSPEGNSFNEMRALTESLMARAHRTFTLTFHSPSVASGHTPYVRSESDLQKFLGDIERFCEFFFGTLGGVASSPLEFKALASSVQESV